MIKLRAFNESGIVRFRSLLEDLRLGETEEVPYDLLEDPELCNVLSDGILLECNGIPTAADGNVPTRLEAARYLNEKLEDLSEEHRENPGMWAWLSMCFLDQLCELKKTGHRKILSDYRMVPTGSYKDYYRHLLAGPYRLFMAHGDLVRVFLGNPVYKVGEVNEQLASRQDIIGNPNLVAVIDKLYYSTKKANFKPGCTTKTGAGSIHRLVKIKKQLVLTYDLFSMEPEEIMALLPAEFNRWK